MTRHTRRPRTALAAVGVAVPMLLLGCGRLDGPVECARFESDMAVARGPGSVFFNPKSGEIERDLPSKTDTDVINKYRDRFKTDPTLFCQNLRDFYN